VTTKTSKKQASIVPNVFFSENMEECQTKLRFNDTLSTKMDHFRDVLPS